MKHHRNPAVNEQYLNAVHKTIPDAIRLLHKKVAEITADLSSEVQAQRRAKAQREFFDKTAEPLRLIYAFRSGIQIERLALSDAQTNLLRHALDDAPNLSPGEVLFAQAFTQLPSAQLQTLVDMVTKPGLLLALHTAINQRDFTDPHIKANLLHRIAAKPPLDTARIQRLASLELIGLKVELAVVLAVTDEDTPLKKRALERKIAAMQRILAGDYSELQDKGD